jgi:predicted DNA-binding transcriptional regulator AlpA
MLDNTAPKYDVLLTRAEVARRLAISIRTLFRLEAEGKLPPRFQVTERIVGYRTREIENYIADRRVGA